MKELVRLWKLFAGEVGGVVLGGSVSYVGGTLAHEVSSRSEGLR